MWSLRSVPAVPRHSRETWRQMLQRSVVSEVAFGSPLPTAAESHCIRSLHLCLRQVWERSCVHPGSYLWCFGPPGSERETKTVLWLSVTSADNPAARSRLGRPLPLLQTDVGDNLLAYTWTRGPNLARRALKHSWLGGVAAAIKACAWRVRSPRTPPPLQELAARKGSGSEGRRDCSRRFDTWCLNFNYLIKDFNSAVNSSANKPGAASEP